jgi:hypothetical protein
MFSGGRDSTIAAVRLARKHGALTLVTVTANHLVGIENVRRRLGHLKPHLPPETLWIQVEQPALPSLESIGQATCLPCQRAYAAVGAAISLRQDIKNLALGYANYQSAWPEQSPEATRRLRRILDQFGLRLELPVYEIGSKADAEVEFNGYGIPAKASEQKCLRQETNLEIPAALLNQELDRWEKSLTEVISNAGKLELSTTQQQLCKIEPDS